MAFKKRLTEIRAFIPTASMADIAFLLIIFFMVTTTFDVDRTRVNLPKSEIRLEVPKGSAYVVIYKEPGTENYGYKFSDGKQMSTPVASLSDLEAQVSAVAAVDPTRPFVIKAEADTPYRIIDTVMDIFRRAGVEEIVMLTFQRTKDDTE